MTEDEMVGWHHWLNGHKLNKLWDMVKDREAWCAAVHGVTKSWTGLSAWRTVLMSKDEEHSKYLFLSPWIHCPSYELVMLVAFGRTWWWRGLRENLWKYTHNVVPGRIWKVLHPQGPKNPLSNDVHNSTTHNLHLLGHILMAKVGQGTLILCLFDGLSFQLFFPFGWFSK